MIFVLFFFSSRRRHTRSLRDWSSDVCSSDLVPVLPRGVVTDLGDEGRDAGALGAGQALDAVPIGSDGDDLGTVGRVGAGIRSEERRVGKECRCRWWRAP